MVVPPATIELVIPPSRPTLALTLTEHGSCPEMHPQHCRIAGAAGAGPDSASERRFGLPKSGIRYRVAALGPMVTVQPHGKQIDPQVDWQEWADTLKSAGLPHYCEHAMRQWPSLGPTCAAVLLCRPRAAPAGAGCRPGLGPPYDRVGRQSHESTTPKPTRNHRAHAVPRRADARHAARQLDQRWRPWRLVPRHEPSMRTWVRFIYLKPAMSAHLPAASRHCHRLLAKAQPKRPAPMRGLTGCLRGPRPSTAAFRLAGADGGEEAADGSGRSFQRG